MNETLKTLVERRSCRAFKPDMIKEEDIQEILKAGMYAPTGGGKQTPTFIVVTNKEMRDKISEENGRIAGAPEGFDPFYGAPVIIMVIANKAFPTYQYDGSLAIGNMLNAAKSLGLGSIWIHRAKEEFDSEFGKGILKELGIEGEYEGIGHVALGYEAKEAAPAAARKEGYVYYIR